MSEPRSALVVAGVTLLGSARFAWALSIAAIATALTAGFGERLLGSAGLVAIVTSLVLLSGLTLFVRRRDLEWQGLLPLSLLTFLAWSTASILWSQYQWATLSGLASLWAFALLGVTIALTRDSIQIVRAFGDCLRVVIGASLTLEVLAGLLIDTPIPALGIAGNLAEGGPIQGVLGSRNEMGLVALIALITFAVELRTRSVTRIVGVNSLVAAALSIVFAQSPVVVGVTIVVGVATAAVAVLRRVSVERRIALHSVLAVAVVTAAVVIYLARSPVIAALNAASESEYRIELWRRLWGLIELRPLEGWGWIGSWNTRIAPFSALDSATGSQHQSGLNGYLDVWLQVGAVGLTLFVALILLTFVRAWLLASRQQTSTIVWGALVLVALITVSGAESTLLSDFGWMILVICSVRAAHQLSWRRHIAPSGPAA